MTMTRNSLTNTVGIFVQIEQLQPPLLSVISSLFFYHSQRCIVVSFEHGFFFDADSAEHPSQYWSHQFLEQRKYDVRIFFEGPRPVRITRPFQHAPKQWRVSLFNIRIENGLDVRRDKLLILGQLR